MVFNFEKKFLKKKLNGYYLILGYLMKMVINEKYFDFINLFIFKSIVMGWNVSFGI